MELLNHPLLLPFLLLRMLNHFSLTLQVFFVIDINTSTYPLQTVNKSKCFIIVKPLIIHWFGLRRLPDLNYWLLADVTGQQEMRTPPGHLIPPLVLPGVRVLPCTHFWFFFLHYEIDCGSLSLPFNPTRVLVFLIQSIEKWMSSQKLRWNTSQRSGISLVTCTCGLYNYVIL